MAAYYNEHDPFAAAWLRELIKDGLIAHGEVDERSITDVSAGDVRGFRQCHWFAGIGGWSYALRLAGLPDDRAVWSGSCPCQPFSSAGAQAGGNDSRDLWPTWAQLITECRPGVVFGEQVSGAIKHGWFDRVCDDLEKDGYAIGAASLPATSVGAFHIRQRLWFVAHANQFGHSRQCGARENGTTERGGLGHAEGSDGEILIQQWEPRSAGIESRGPGRTPVTWPTPRTPTGGPELATRKVELGRKSGGSDLEDVAMQSDLANADGIVTGDTGIQRGRRFVQPTEKKAIGFWDDAEWIECTDGKARAIEPGSFPLAHGVPARMGRLRGYGNAIVPQVAQVFIEAYLDTLTE